jgi:hypothetical protein
MKCLCVAVKKLEALLESRFLCAAREVGFPLAQKLGAIAQKMGQRICKGLGFGLALCKVLSGNGLFICLKNTVSKEG